MTSILYVLMFKRNEESTKTPSHIHLSRDIKIPVIQPPDTSNLYKPMTKVFSSNKKRSSFIEQKLSEHDEYKITNVEIESFSDDFLCI